MSLRRLASISMNPRRHFGEKVFFDPWCSFGACFVNLFCNHDDGNAGPHLSGKNALNQNGFRCSCFPPILCFFCLPASLSEFICVYNSLLLTLLHFSKNEESTAQFKIWITSEQQKKWQRLQRKLFCSFKSFNIHVVIAKVSGAWANLLGIQVMNDINVIIFNSPTFHQQPNGSKFEYRI